MLQNEIKKLNNNNKKKEERRKKNINKATKKEWKLIKNFKPRWSSFSLLERHDDLFNGLDGWF